MVLPDIYFDIYPRMKTSFVESPIILALSEPSKGEDNAARIVLNCLPGVDLLEIHTLKITSVDIVFC